MRRTLPPGAIYARQSKTDDQVDSQSIKEQAENAGRLAAVREYGIADEHIFHDENLSGEYPPTCWRRKQRGKSRDGLSNLITCIERGEIRAVFVRRLDRLARSMRLQLEIFDLLREHNCKLYCYDEDVKIEGSEGGEELDLQMRAMIAEHQLRQIKKQAKRTKAFMKDKGLFLGGNIPVGYRRVPHGDNDWKIVIDDGAAAFVRELFNRYANGARWADLCRYADAHHGDKHKFGGQRFRMEQIQATLGRLSYAGLARNSADVEVTTTTFPAIVPAELFNRVRDRMKAEGGLRTRGKNKPHLLSGFLFCTGCGKPIRASAKYDRIDKKKRVGTKWVCFSTGCKEDRAFHMDERLWNEFVEVFFSDYLIKDQDNPKMAGLRLRLSMISENIAALENKTAKGHMDASRFERVIAIADEERLRVQKELDAMPPAASWQKVEWKAMTFDEHRAVLKSIVAKIQVGRTAISVRTTKGHVLDFPLMHRKIATTNAPVNCLTPPRLSRNVAQEIIVKLNGIPYYANDICVDWGWRLDKDFRYAVTGEAERRRNLVDEHARRLALGDFSLLEQPIQR